MSDQLSLRLETDRLPDLPDLRPMQPRPLPEPFDSDEHLFEPWWGGVRALALIGPADAPGDGEVRIVDAEGVDLSAALPELAGMAVRVAARSAILDGELVVVDAAGRADPADAGGPAGRRRGAAGRVPRVRPAASRRSLAARQPLGRRREALRKVLRPGDEVVAVPAIATEGGALYDAAVAQGIAGILARQRMSPYLPGHPQPAVAVRAGHAGECRAGPRGRGGRRGELPPPTAAAARSSR